MEHPVVVFYGRHVSFLPNDEHVHHYQRGRASITGLGLKSGEIIETERLVVVARCGLFSGLHYLVLRGSWISTFLGR